MKINKLSIVIIAKNEEKSIGECLEQLEKIKFVNKEIILVDSNSIDKTRDIAKKFPIKIINIEKSNIYSAPAGRKIGLEHAKGEYVLFMDGDQIINLEWLKKYLYFLQKNNFDAVYGGYNHISYLKKFSGFPKITDISPQGNKVKQLVGSFLVRNSDSLRKENFDPFMLGEEERDLAYRLIINGYRIFKTKEVMAAHFLKKEDSNEIKKEINFMIGSGQLIRKYLFSRFFLDVLRLSIKYLFVIFFTVLFLLSSALIPNLYFTLLLVSIFFTIVLIKNNLKIDKHYFIIILKGILFPIKVLQGVILESKMTNKFCYEIKIIKEG